MPCVGVPLLWDTVDSHLSEEEMVAFVARRLPETRRAEAARHVAECELCLDSVAAMESVRTDRARGHPVSKPKIWRRRRPGVPWFAIAGVAGGGLAGGGGWFITGPSHPSGPPQPAIVASLHDAGGTIELDAPRNASIGLDAASPEEQNLVREALERGSLPTGQALSGGGAGRALGPGTTAPPFAPLGPLNTRVLSDRPVFNWQVYPGAAHYQVLVTNENLDPLARSGMLTGTEWQPEKGLPRGVILLWQVRAWHGSEMVSAPAPPAPPARFEIAAEPVAERIEQLRTLPRPSHLLAAVLCAQAGLRDEAAKELQALAQENPDSKVVGSLEGSAAR